MSDSTMNRQQRRAEKRQQPHTPRPLKSGGKSFSFAGSMEGGLFDQGGGELLKGVPDLDALVECYGYRTLIGQRQIGAIGGVWVVPTDEPLPVPQFILDAIMEQGRAGRSFLLLASDPVARDRAKAAIYAMLNDAAGTA